MRDIRWHVDDVSHAIGDIIDDDGVKVCLGKLGRHSYDTSVKTIFVRFWVPKRIKRMNSRSEQHAHL